MRFWLISLPLYLVLLAAGLGLPGVVIWRRAALDWSGMALYGASALLLVIAAVVLALELARLLFPAYWWMGQVEGKDVFEFDGVYFLGLRLTRVPTRLQRMLFGVDEQMRTWDLIFGVMFLVLLVPHTVAFFGANRALDHWLPDPPRFPESLNEPLLSSLPVMRQWGTTWQVDGPVAGRVQQTLAGLQREAQPTVPQRFELAQLYLLRAFPERRHFSDPYYSSPGERLYFNRGEGVQAVNNLQVLLNLPQLQRANWSGGALALMGFFYLNDHNFPQAQATLARAVAEMGEGDQSHIPRYLVLLLAAQSALMNSQPDQAIDYLERILTNERLPNEAYALAMEHDAEALRLSRRFKRVPALLDKAQELYKLSGDRAGIARVHVRRAALDLDQHRRQAAAKELSLASSEAQGLSDGFTQDMVARLTLAFSR